MVQYDGGVKETVVSRVGIRGDVRASAVTKQTE